MADNVESQRARAADNQELRQVVHGCHYAGCACAPEDGGGHLAEIRDGVEERNKGDQEADGDGCLVEEELGWRDGEVFNLLANPDLVQCGGAECQCRDDDAEELRLSRHVHCK